MLFVTIGTFEEENYADWLVRMLEWVLPLTVIIAAILDSILVWVYMKYAHPWKGILADEKENPWKDILAEEKENNSKQPKKKQKKSKLSLRRNIPDDFM